jgi:hypothetical protein
MFTASDEVRPNDISFEQVLKGVGKRFLLVAIVPSQPLLLSEPLERRHIGANDITNSADFGVAVDFFGIGPLLAERILEGFDCDIESDFVPELKTVGNGFRC